MPKTKNPSKMAAKKNGGSTRDSIVNCAREILNNVGVIDFRIEMLAKSLDLSPGNITYHFPRKEDIISAVWSDYQQILDDLSSQVNTPLLDVKQLFLIHRSAAMKSLDYLGVKTYYFGDVGNLKREWEFNDKFSKRIFNSIRLSFDILVRNGYMKPIEDEQMLQLTCESQFILLRWWYNFAMLDCDIEKVKADTDKHIVNALYPMVPYFTESGRHQFENIKTVIK